MLRVDGRRGETPRLLLSGARPRHGDDPKLRKIVRLLEPIREPGSVTIILAWLAAYSPAARELAAGVLATNPDERVSAALDARLAAESAEEVLLALVSAAGRRGDRDLAGAIVSAAERAAKSVRVRLAALNALAGLGFDQAAVARYFEACAGVEDWAERAAALEIAAKSDDPGAAPLLIAMLGDPVWQVRLTAVEGLGRLRVREAAGPLVSRLETEEVKRVRRLMRRARAGR